MKKYNSKGVFIMNNTALEHFNLEDMTKEMNTILEDFVGNDFFVHHLLHMRKRAYVREYFEGEYRNIEEVLSDLFTINLGDILRYYFMKPQLSEVEEDGLRKLLEYYKKRDESHLLRILGNIENDYANVASETELNSVAQFYLTDYIYLDVE